MTTVTEAPPAPAQDATTAEAETTPPADTTTGAETGPEARAVPTVSAALVLRTLEDKLEYSRKLAHSRMTPNVYWGRPENVFYAVEVGAMLGLHPMAAINNIHIIDGKASMSAILMQSKARDAGHIVRVWDEVDDNGLPVGCCQIIRNDDPDFKPVVRFTMEDAARAELCEITNGKVKAASRRDPSKSTNWQKWPRNMAKHRAVAECVRDRCPEVLMGVMHTPEELGAQVDEDGNFVAYAEGTADRANADRANAYEGRPADDGIIDADVVEDIPTADRHAFLMAEIAEIAEILGMPFADAALPVVRQIVELPEGSGGDTVIRALQTADPADILRILGPLRAAIVQRLREKGEHETADAYTSAGMNEVGPAEKLFGRPPRGRVPDALRADGPAEGPGEAAEGGENPGADRDETAPEGAPQDDPQDGGGSAPQPHLFSPRENAPDWCTECHLGAHDLIHDPRRGM